ncbi:NEP1-interacting protein-like 1 isoform X2 [Ziziphus jujuba]|uniref:NEP1-interacting protein-like 1 isoform X2 n=1 Tax=Ziziphus jujuba TaxID=326968 RepID=A0A6P4B861_ZIZJJ|nr:NEP1-interacting protein-like 1 isoform X2 [Ziziphus jujuba]
MPIPLLTLYKYFSFFHKFPRQSSALSHSLFFSLTLHSSNMSIPAICPTMKEWFSGAMKVAFRSKEVFSLWVLAATCGSGSASRPLLKLIVKKIIFAVFTCILALGGAIVGTILGAIKGQTTETGFLKGAGIGGLTGAIAAIQLLDSAVDGEPLSKVSTVETNYREISDIYDIAAIKGLSQHCIQKLPSLKYHSSKLPDNPHDFCCSVCLQEWKEGESVRRLPKCGHFFHMECIDKWLMRQVSCPMCRIYVCNDNTSVS